MEEWEPGGAWIWVLPVPWHRNNEVPTLPLPATWSRSSVLDINLLNFPFYLPKIHLNLPLCSLLAAAPTPWPLSKFSPCRPSFHHLPVGFSSHKSCYMFLENWRSVILSCRCLKNPIYKSAVACIQCPNANTALVHKLMLLRKKNCISEG